MSEKTEQPTDKKLREARAQGQVAKSADLTVLAQLSFILVFLVIQAESLYHSIGMLIDVTIASVNLPLQEAWGHINGALGEVIIRFMAPLLGLLGIVSVASIVAQTGFVFAPKVLQPKFSKLNPLSNAKQIFSMKNLFEFGKSVLKVLILTAIFYVLMKQHLTALQFIPVCGIECGFRMTCELVMSMWIALLIFYLFLGIIDFAFQKRTVLKQLMMSKQDIKQEHKNSEGNQEIKNERKKVQREIQSGSLASNVKKSSAIIRNPTHIAICIYFKSGDTPLPQVLEKGTDAMARHIVKLAEKAGVPVFENISLARALHAGTERGAYIPAELFGPIAEILHTIKEMDIDSMEKS